MTIELKIKLKSLAYEAKEIRKYEKQLFQASTRLNREDLLWKASSLHSHRIHVVRKATRETHLAYGYLKGFPLERIEKNSKIPPNWKNVFKMVQKYGPYKTKQRETFALWAGLNCEETKNL